MKILLCVLSNQNYISYLPLGVAYIASVLRNNNHEVTIYSQDIHHYPEEHLTTYLNENKFDVVGVGAISGYFPYRKLLQASEAINRSINRPFFILGGHMPSANPQYFLKKTGTDCVIRGEAFISFVEILNMISRKEEVPNVVEGKLINDLDYLPFPAYDMFLMEYYRLQRYPHIKNNEFSVSMITGIGCNFRCTFCQRIVPGIRLRSVNSIVEEIKLLKKNYNISYIDFADDLTFASKQRTAELCETFIKNDLNIKWRCEGRLNYVDSDILKLVKKAGCVFINYGIEALDDKVLAGMNKALTVSKIINGVEATLNEGISPGLNVLWGNLYDTPETLKKAVEFLLKYDDGAQVRTIHPVIPFPGTELFETAKEKGLLKDTEDFYEKKHTNSDLLTVNFTELTDEEFYKELYKANFQLLHNYNKNRLYDYEKQLKNIYLTKDVSFRGFTHK
jgi:radical SAM superfamily enzyme YgiQ (UPF0313 family)